MTGFGGLLWILAIGALVVFMMRRGGGCCGSGHDHDHDHGTDKKQSRTGCCG
jgi:hypothetical protein